MCPLSLRIKLLSFTHSSATPDLKPVIWGHLACVCLRVCMSMREGVLLNVWPDFAYRSYWRERHIKGRPSTFPFFVWVFPLRLGHLSLVQPRGCCAPLRKSKKQSSAKRISPTRTLVKLRGQVAQHGLATVNVIDIGLTLKTDAYTSTRTHTHWASTISTPWLP